MCNSATRRTNSDGRTVTNWFDVDVLFQWTAGINQSKGKFTENDRLTIVRYIYFSLSLKCLFCPIRIFFFFLVYWIFSIIYCINSLRVDIYEIFIDLLQKEKLISSFTLNLYISLIWYVIAAYFYWYAFKFSWKMIFLPIFYRYRLIFNHIAEVYIRTSRISTMEVFCEIS